MLEDGKGGVNAEEGEAQDGGDVDKTEIEVSLDRVNSTHNVVDRSGVRKARWATWRKQERPVVRRKPNRTKNK